MVMNKETHYNNIVDIFNKNECKLLTTFKDFTNKIDKNLQFECKCGNIEKNIDFKWYNRSVYKSCKKCKLANNPRRNEEFNNMVKYFQKYGCNLLIEKKDYVNQQTKLTYQCKCNKIVENETYQLYYLSTYKCCIDCRDKVINHRYHPFEKLQQKFIKENIELLTKKDDYKGVNCNKLSYKCKCGVILTNMSYQSFKLSKYKQCKECVKNLIKKTCLEKYGYERPMQNSYILNKSIKNQYNLKEFIYASGNKIKIQGYEDLALQILTENNYNEKDIITDRIIIPTFDYIYKNNNKKYLPDIFIKSENKIIEVKSDHTFNTMKIQNILKALAVRKAGYDFEFWIFYKVRKHDTPNYKYKKSMLKLFKI
jgi:hypothetical protein